MYKGLIQLKYLLLIYLAFVLAGCSTKSHLIQISADTSSKADKFDISLSNKPESVLLQKEDVIKLLVWGHPELSHNASVQKDGNITLPLIGEVRAEGRTIKSLQNDVKTLLMAKSKTELIRLQKDDILKLHVWRYPELTHQASIQIDGFITLPLIGQIKAFNRSIPDVTQEIRKKLKKFIKTPDVSLLPIKLQNSTVGSPIVSILPEKLKKRMVAVLGEVKIPGLKQMHGNMRVVDALAMSGYQDSSDLNSVIVIRNHNRERPLYASLKLDDYLEDGAIEQNIYLRADDIVIVPKTTIAKIGSFIDQFFTKTKPVFDWWVAANQARYAKDVGIATRRLNDLLIP